MGKKGSSKKISGKQVAIVVVLAALLLLVLFRPQPGKKPVKKPVFQTETYNSDPEFVKHGELWFQSGTTGDTISQIDIEIVETPAKRNQGLMYRRSMADSLGMLFIFQQPDRLSFWMKNTYISLDILFITADFEIATIHRNTEPFSERSLFATESCLYTVEVVAGYCERLGIREGDKIAFTRTQPAYGLNTLN